MRKYLGCFVKGKKGGGLGTIVEMSVMIVIVSVVMVSVFSISATAYSYEISVRDAEARILTKKIIQCLSPDAVLVLNNIKEKEKSEILSYCGFSSSKRIYVGVDILDSSGEKVISLHDGDSGLLWVRDLFEKTVLVGEELSGATNENLKRMAKYNPGYFSLNYSSVIVSGENEFDGVIKIEVLVNHEE